MARQKGPVPFVGRIGDLSFYKDKQHGYLIRQKGGPNKKQIKTKKSMEVVRQNNTEFGRASGYGALLRGSMGMLVRHCREYTMSRRLQSVLQSIIRMDEGHEPGERVVLKKHLISLQGFELNEQFSYRKFFKEDVDIQIQKKALVAKAQCSIPKTVAKRADNYQVVSVAAAIDFERMKFFSDVKESGLLTLKESNNFVFEHSLKTEGYVFYGLVLCFYKKNGKKMELITENGMKAGFVSFVE